MSAVPYAEALGGRDPLLVLAATPADLAQLLTRAEGRGADTPLAAGKWSTRELMAHLADCEVAWAWRLRQAFGSERAQMQPFDQDAWARMYGSAYTLDEARAAFFALRAWNLAFLRGLAPADRTRPVFHPERGEETLWTIAEIAAGHDLHHLRLLEAQLA